FELSQDIIGTNGLTEFHNDWYIHVQVDDGRGTMNDAHKTLPPLSSKVFYQTGTIVEFCRDIIISHVLRKFHDDLTKKYYINITKGNMPTPSQPCFTYGPEPFLNSTDISMGQMF
ncbi:hypothetical protein DPMN_099817, partial [Dreissena polymorpha]